MALQRREIVASVTMTLEDGTTLIFTGVHAVYRVSDNSEKGTHSSRRQWLEHELLWTVPLPDPTTDKET